MTHCDSYQREVKATRRAALARLTARGITVPGGKMAKTTVVEKAICDWMGWKPAHDPMDTLRQYVVLVDDTPRREGRYVGEVVPASDRKPKERDAYKPSLAMRIAAERASVQPPLLAAVSKVDNWREFPEGRRR